MKNHRTSTRRALGAGLCLALLLTACGGADDPAAPAEDASEPAGEESETEAEGEAPAEEPESEQPDESAAA